MVSKGKGQRGSLQQPRGKARQLQTSASMVQTGERDIGAEGFEPQLGREFCVPASSRADV
jgi:hypothetical protein